MSGIYFDGPNSKVTGYQQLLSQGHLSKSVAGAVDVALSSSDLQNKFFVLTGALTGSINVTCGDPTALAGAEVVVYNDTSGAYTLTWKGTSGTGIVLPRGRAVTLRCDGTNWLQVQAPDILLQKSMGSDANYTASNAEAGSDIIEVTSGVALTATRDFILPLNAGRSMLVYNGTTGAQSVRFIGASGTGVTVTNGKRAVIGCNGTNWDRFSADI
jgi:hypothetical protein